MKRKVVDIKEIKDCSFKELETFLVTSFIPNNYEMTIKKVVGNSTIDSRPVPTIKAKVIQALDLPQAKIEYIFRFLAQEGIRVSGCSKKLDAAYENYDYAIPYGLRDSERPLSREEQIAKFRELRKTGNPEIREELIITNMRLVPWYALKLAQLHQIEYQELESAGYVGLIKAVDTFNPDKGVAFSTFAVNQIKYAMRNIIPASVGATRGDYYNFRNAIIEYESTYDEVFIGTDEQVEIVLNIMVKCKEVYKRQEIAKLRGIFRKRLAIDKLSADIVSFNTCEANIMYADLQDVMASIFAELSIDEENYLRERYGFNDGTIKSTHEMQVLYFPEKDINFVRRFESNIMRKLRREYIPMLEEYLNLFFSTEYLGIDIETDSYKIPHKLTRKCNF